MLLVPNYVFSQMAEVSQNLPVFQKGFGRPVQGPPTVALDGAGLATITQHICNLYLALDLMLLVSSGLVFLNFTT